MSQHFLCLKQEISAGDARGFNVELESETLQLFLIKHDGEIYAYKNHCPHLGIPLNWQPDQFLSLEQSHIQCSTHGALFNLDNGYCIVGPCAGEQLTPLPIEHRDDEIWLQLDSPILIDKEVG
ncbi:MAG: Rieske (2Fe-2S) protein [Gammaproteobacteria bacterium]|nr:Rieske (2Fe-2S) protein [Gammaproteobacteria bacterium]